MEDAFGLVGTTLRDQYRIDAVAGEGGFGVVYRALHLGFDQPVAVKCLKLRADLPAAARQTILASFKAEAKTLFQLSQHPSIVRVLETGLTAAQVPFLVMEWLDGHDVDAELDARLRAGLGPYTERDAVELLRPAVEGIASAHRRGYAHRDIKPPNLFVCDTAMGRTVKVLDFGVAKVMQDGDTATRAITNANPAARPFSPTHGAPEQVSAERFGATGPWTDVHALALVLVELVTGRPALRGDNLYALLAAAMDERRPTPWARGADVSAAFEAVCAKALSLSPPRRFADAGALLAALDAALAPARVASVATADRVRESTDPFPEGYLPEAYVAPQNESTTERRVVGAVPRTSEPTLPVPGTRPPREGLRELIGEEIAGFRLTAALGEGAMAVVFRGENVLTPGIARAIKIVRPELGSRPELAARFSTEALTLEQLSHPNIVRFHGLRTHVHGGTRLLVMELELLDGETLAGVRGAAPPELVVEWIRMAASGVAAAHARSVVHRDLKPDNLFLTRERVIKVLDFGIAKALDDADRASGLTREGATPGTPAYMAPEVCRGAVPDARADVYALGVTLMELLLGYHPYGPPGAPPRSSAQLMYAHANEPLPSLRAAWPEVPAALDAVLQRATAKEPAERFRDAGELAEALARVDLRAVEPATPRVQTTAPLDAAKKTDVLLPPGTPLARTEPLGVPTRTEPGGRGALGPRWIAIASAMVAVLLLGALVWVGVTSDESAVVPTVDSAGPAGEGEPPGDSAEPPGDEPDPIEPFVLLNHWIAQPSSHSTRLGLSREEAPRDWLGFRPSREIRAPRTSYDLQAHEVTWSELQPYLDADESRRFPAPTWLPDDRSRYPATGVPWAIASGYCRSIGGDLPTEEQWELAARGATRRPMPWGDAPVDPARTRIYGGVSGHPGVVMTHSQDRTPNDEPLWDMLGNALEWTRDVYRHDQPGEDESWTRDGEGRVYRTVRGVPPYGDPPAPLQDELAAHRDALCAEGPCPEQARAILEHVGFRCVR